MKKHLLLWAFMATSLASFANWGTTVDDPIDLFPADFGTYGWEVKTGSDGTIWACFYHPNLENAKDEYDTGEVIYEYRVQCYDTDGNAKFAPEGLLVSDYENWSWTVVENRMLVDRDGNAIVAVSDCRNSSDRDKSYTLYKISPEGEMLWGEDGVALTDPLKPSSLLAWLTMVQLEDGSYVFAWTEYEDTTSHIGMQRISNAGEPQWDLAKMSMTDQVTGYPILVNSGDNTCILVFGKTASAVMYARKIDFEGESVWGKDVRIYRGGWGSTPLQTIINAVPSGDGGVLFTWTDDRAGENIESAYISYITADGKLGFAGISDDADCKLCYDEWRCFSVCAVPAADGSCFYAIWRTTNQSQRYQGVKMQKISKSGELLWGDDALELEPVVEGTVGYLSLQPCDESDAVAFYMKYRAYYDQQGYASRFNSNGDYVWDEGMVTVTPAQHQCAQMRSFPFIDGSWICAWAESGTVGNKVELYQMTRLNPDGTLGVDASVANVAVDSTALSYSAGTLYGPEDSTVKVYTPTGALAATYKLDGGMAAIDLPAGLYLATTGNGGVKIAVK